MSYQFGLKNNMKVISKKRKSPLLLNDGKIMHKYTLIMLMFISLILIIAIPASKAASFVLTSKVNLSAANGKGGVDLDWSTIDPKNKTFMLYQQKEGSSEWKSISTVDFEGWIQPINILNVYPTAPENSNYIPYVTFYYNDGTSAYMKKSAALKVWMEGGTMVEGGSVTTFEPYGKNPKTGQQLLYITPMTAQAFNSNPDVAWNYDVIMFGTWDTNGTGSDQPNDRAINVLRSYIEQGYGVLCGHDTIGYSYGGAGLNKLKNYFNITTGFWSSGPTGYVSGIDYQESWGYASSNVRVDRQGLLTNFPWELPLGSILSVPTAHSCANAAKGDVWMNFCNGWWWNTYPGSTYTHEGNPIYYLTTNNNTAMIQTGHSNCASTADERKVLANTLFYLKQRTSSTSTTDNSAQDFATPNAPTIKVRGVDQNNNINIVLHAEDRGTRYSFYAEAHQANDYSQVIRSNITSQTVTTGVKKYYYVIDDNPSNNFNISNAQGQTTTELIKISNNNYGRWLHIKAEDAAGNVGPVANIKIEMKYENNITNTIKKTATANETNPNNGNSVITKLGDSVKYNINYNVQVKDFIGKAKIKIVDQLPAEIDITKSNLGGGTYNNQNKTITWEYTIPYIDTFYSGTVNKNYNMNIELYYINMPDLNAGLKNTVIGYATIYIDPNREIGKEQATDYKIVEQKYITQIAGKVWLDNNKNGQFGDSADAPMEKMTVILHKYENHTDQIIAQTKTNSEGNYIFSNLDGSKQYYIEFKYNGQYYEPTKYKVGSAYSSSKGVDKISDRAAFNNKFYQIQSNPNYSGGNVYTRNELLAGGYIDKYGNPTNKQNQYVQDCMTSSYTGYNQNNTFYINSYPSKEMAAEFGLKWPSDEMNVYVNQGFVARETMDIAINQDIQKVTLTIHGKAQEYTYAKRKDAYEIAEKLKNYYDANYTRELYVEDYFYKETDPLEIYVTYRIGIKNNSSQITVVPTEIVDYYDSEYTISSYEVKDKNGNTYNDLLNFKDKSDYGSNLSVSGYKTIYITSNKEIQIQPGSEIDIFLTFSVNKQNDELLINNKKSNIVEISCYRTYYHTNCFIPNQGNNKTQQEFYAGDRAGIVDQDSTPFNLNVKAIGKQTLFQGATIESIKNTYGIEDDADIAPSIKFTYNKENNTQFTREISGTVWEDSRNTEVEKSLIGDGVMDENKKVSGITVELIDLKESEKQGKEIVAQVFENNTWITAKKLTDENGNYEFKGYIPSDYVVKFTYGNIQDDSGLVQYNGQDYKSTIYYSPKSNMEYNIDNPDKDDYEYNLAQADIDNNPENYGINKAITYYSDARDIMENTQIGNSENANYKNGTNAEKTGSRTYVSNYSTNNGEGAANRIAQELKDTTTKTSMIAKSGKIVANIEYDRTSSQTSITGENNAGNKNYELSGFYKINNLDFGIVERPKAQLKITKQITNVKVILADGTTLFDSSSKATNTLWQYHIAHSPDTNNSYQAYDSIGTTKGNYTTGKFMKVPTVRESATSKGIIELTMDKEIMHGAEIKITYAITVANIGEIDYEGNMFYYKGISTNEISTTTAKMLIDYVGYQADSGNATRNNLQFIAIDNPEWNIISEDSLDELVSRSVSQKAKQYTTIIGTKASATISNKNLIPILADQDNATQISKLFENDPLNAVDKINTTSQSVAAVKLVLTQMITPDSDSDDMTYNNMVELVRTSNSVGRKMAYSVAGNQDPTLEPTEIDSDDSQEVKIMPPYGQRTIYYILAGTIAVILILGVIAVVKILKKK